MKKLLGSLFLVAVAACLTGPSLLRGADIHITDLTAQDPNFLITCNSFEGGFFVNGSALGCNGAGRSDSISVSESDTADNNFSGEWFAPGGVTETRGDVWFVGGDILDAGKASDHLTFHEFNNPFTGFADIVGTFRSDVSGIIGPPPGAHLWNERRAFVFDNTFLTASAQSDVGTRTPEPGSLLLLSTGLMGLAGAVKRRFLR